MRAVVNPFQTGQPEKNVKLEANRLSDSLFRGLCDRTKYYHDVERIEGSQFANGWTYVQYTDGTNRQPSLIISPDPTRPAIFMEYDENGNVTLIDDIDRGGDADRDGRDDNPQRMEYDEYNNLVRMTDPRGLVTEYAYNVHNQQTGMTRAVGTPLASTWAWDYDLATGFLLSETDSSGIVKAYTYDPRGNILTETVAPGTAAEIVTTYEYDSFSRPTSVTDGAGRRTEYTYDGWDRVLTTTLVATTSLQSSSTYDPATGRKLMDVDYIGNTTSYTYDPTTGDLIAMEQTGIQPTQMEYDRFGNLERVIDPVGNVTLFVYDEVQRLVHQVSLGSTTRVLEAVGSNADVVIEFTDPIDPALIDDGIDFYVKDALDQPVVGTASLSPDGLTLTWIATTSPLAEGEYTITLAAEEAGEFTTSGGDLLDGEFYNSLPSGDNRAGGDFVFTFLVDDHGNDAAHATPMTVPGDELGELAPNGDVDWFAIDVNEGSRFRFEIVLDTLFDSILRLYDIDGETLLDVNDDIDSNAGQYGSRIDWEAPRTGRYYLEVDSFAGRYTGAYQLNTEILADDHADDSTGATVITVPSVTEGRLEVPTDKDVFAMDASEGVEYRITTLLDTLSDSYLKVYDTDGVTLLAENDEFFNGDPASFLYWTAPAAGTYFIEVSSDGENFAGTYELAVSVDDHGDYGTIATPVAVDSQTASDIEVPGDNDWFSFVATTGTDYRLDTTLGTLPDSLLVLVDTDGMISLGGNDDYVGKESRFYWTAPADGTYYLRASGFDGSGTYTLGVRALADDHGDDAATSTSVLVPSTTPGEIEMPGDADWFQFPAVTDQWYRLETILGDLPDTLIRLYDVDGTTLLLENDDSNGLQSRIDWQASVEGTYYVEVVSAFSSLAGTYDLHLFELEKTPPESALAYPVPGSVVTTDLGYVDISWTDVGLGIDPATIGASDITITGVNVASVEDQGSGVWRYSYDGDLKDGPVEVAVLGLRVADLAENWNEERIETFVFDTGAPTVEISQVTPNPRLGEVATLMITFSERIEGLDVGDLSLTYNGGANLLTASQTISTEDNITFELGELEFLTVETGTYQLTLIAAGSLIEDAAGRLLIEDSAMSWEAIEPAEIHGVVYSDRNSNGLQDADEYGLADWIVYLDLNNDRERDSDEPFVVTANDGAYAFTSLYPGTYTVAQERRENWDQISPNPNTRPAGSPPSDAAIGTAPMPMLSTTASTAPIFPTGFTTPISEELLEPSTAQSSDLIHLSDFKDDWRFDEIRGAGYATVILDTGIDPDHSFFGPDSNGDGVADRIVYQYDFADDDADASDHNGHGSNVTSIVASQDPQYPGAANEANIIHLKVFGDDDSGSFAYTEAALQWVVAHAAEYNIVSVNMSLGDEENFDAPVSLYGIGDELSALATLGVIVISASGNDYYDFNSTPGVAYPSADPHSLSIGATYDGNVGSSSYGGGAQAYTTNVDRITPFSQRHSSLTTVFAPGAAITGAGLSGGLTTMHGTSQASPQIAGLAVLVQQLAQKELGRLLTPAEFTALLRDTAATIYDGDDEDDNVLHTYLEYPRADAEMLGEAIISMSGPGPGTYQVTLTSGESVAGYDFGDHTDHDIDFGDAPQPYPTLLANSGARHVGTGPTLGTVRDVEPDGQPTVLADGDDVAGVPDDEDGLLSIPVLAPGLKQTQLNIHASGPSFLNAWIDYNANGIWEPSEQVAIDAPLIAGSNQILVDVPITAVPGTTYARLRLTSYNTGGTLLPTGLANDGEVEDYQFLIENDIYLEATTGDDTVRIYPGTPGGAQHRVQINSVDSFFDATVFDTIYVDGLGGTDTINVYGKATNENAAFDGTFVQVSESTVYDVYGQGFENSYVYGGGGVDTSTMLGSTGNDNFYANETYSYLRGNSNAFFNYAKNFASVSVDVSGGSGTDQAYMYDSAGDDILIAGETQATLDYDSAISLGVNVTASGFDRVDTYGQYGGTDNATLIGSSGNDTFTGLEAYSYLNGNSGAFYNYTKGFDAVTANVASSGGTDSATLYDSPGDDTLNAGETQAVLDYYATAAPNPNLTAVGFPNVSVYALFGGDDTATLTGSSGNDKFTGRETYGRMKGNSSAFINFAKGFDTLTGDVSGTTGLDIANLYDASTDDDLVAGDTSAYFDYAATGTPDPDLIATGFDQTYSYATSGGNDTSVMNGSSGVDRFTAKSTYTNLKGNSGAYFHYGTGFDESFADATLGGEGGLDKAFIYDDTTGDKFTGGPTQATLDYDQNGSPGVDVTANGFDEVYAYADNGGTDAAVLNGSSSTTDKFYGLATYGYFKATDNSFYNYARGFDTVLANAVGSGDLAFMYGSDGDDTLNVESSQAAFSLNPTATPSVVNTATAFDQVYSYASGGGTDKAYLNGTTGADTFTGEEDWGYLRSTGTTDYFNYVRYFDEVFADPGDTTGGNDDLNDLGVSYMLDDDPSNGNIW